MYLDAFQMPKMPSVNYCHTFQCCWVSLGKSLKPVEELYDTALGTTTGWVVRYDADADDISNLSVRVPEVDSNGISHCSHLFNNG